MRDTYAKLNYHLVFSTKNRAPLITKAVQDDIYGYCGGILRGNGGVLLAAGGMPDHVHLLAGWGTSISVAKMLQLVKTNSSKWMNDRPGVASGSFGWQIGYAAFSVNESQIPVVKKYIQNQEEHHRKMSFQEEFEELLKRHGITLDPDDFKKPEE
jgi:REP element-mobilizing transposase RayT